jgi:hypothetical protein
MNACRAVALVGLATAFFAASTSTVLAAGFCAPGQSPKFAFGFAALSGQLGATMGDATECEHSNASNGDTLQATTTGLAFYRKATNTPTFTDGFNHWGLTADGLVAWTGQSVDPQGAIVVTPTSKVPAPTPPSLVSPPPSPEPTYQTRKGARTAGQLHDELMAAGYGGPWDVQSMLAAYQRATAPTASMCFRASDSHFVQELPSGYERSIIAGTVTNACNEPVAGTIAVSRLSTSMQGGANVGDLSFEIALGTLAANGRQDFQIPVGKVPQGNYYYWDFSYRNLPTGSTGLGLPCWNVQSDRCIQADARLEGELYSLGQNPAGRQLQQTAARWGVVVRLAHLPVGTLGSYLPATRTASVNDELLPYGVFERAAVLAHELQHASQDADGQLGAGETCYRDEFDAFVREGEIWLTLWSGRLPLPQNSLQYELNDIAIRAAVDPLSLARTYLTNYGHQCA